MNPTGIALFDLAEQRLAWVDRRQQLLAQNIANADTPGYRARDLKPFDAALTQASASAAENLALTDPHHLAGRGGRAARGQAAIGERAPDGNAVRLDVELTRIADTETTHELVTDLYKKYVGMFRTALGR